jgi:hypothetical protein
MPEAFGNQKVIVISINLNKDNYSSIINEVKYGKNRR